MKMIDAEAILCEINDYLVDRSDVVDGEAGPVPNTEMSLLADVVKADAVISAMAGIVRSLAGLREGLANSNSGAEDAAGKLAERAQKVLEGRA